MAMTHEAGPPGEEVGSLADELRLLAATLAARDEDGAAGLLDRLRSTLAELGGGPDDEPQVQRIELS